MSVIAVLLMFAAVMVMVKNVGNDRKQHAILPPNSRKTEGTISLRK